MGIAVLGEKERMTTSTEVLAGVPAEALSPPAQLRLRHQGLLGLGESYMDGEWNTTSLDHLLFTLMRDEQTRCLRPWGALFRYVYLEYFRNSQQGKGAFRVAEQHYDLGNDLFSAMLDPSMTYTCGVWRSARTLEEAQRAKLQLVCEKLGLRPGMRVLDIGCGWGNFAQYAAQHFGVSVVGLTVSKEQATFARERCKGLPIEIVVQDYKQYVGLFDRVVSIEMIEAVGKKNLPGYFSMIHRSLRPEGRFVLQAISADTFSRFSSPAFDQFGLFLLKYIFPNGYLPTMRELTEPGRHGFRIDHMDNFAPDYDRTLQAWLHNFEQGWSGLQEKYGERFRRMWKYYLSGCMASFRSGKLQVYQIVYSKR